jgi:hypothetical protein
MTPARALAALLELLVAEAAPDAAEAAAACRCAAQVGAGLGKPKKKPNPGELLKFPGLDPSDPRYDGPPPIVLRRRRRVTL